MLAFVAEDASELFLRAAPVAIAVGRVDQVDAERDRLVYHALRRREVDAAAEIVAAEPDHGHLERRGAQPACLHRCEPFLVTLACARSALILRGCVAAVSKAEWEQDS